MKVKKQVKDGKQREIAKLIKKKMDKIKGKGE